jgi:hypothetical protein
MKKKRFILKTSKTQLVFAIGLIVLAIILYCVGYFKYNLSFQGQWGNWLEAYATGSIILVSVAIWYNEKRENWIDSLPKKLNIIYRIKNKNDGWETFCEIQNAPLSHEGDIRNWGQSIGQTILNEQARISFSGFFIEGPVLDKTKNHMISTLTVYLKTPISNISKDTKIEFDDMGFFNEFERQPDTPTTITEKIIISINKLNEQQLAKDFITKNLKDINYVLNNIDQKITKNKEDINKHAESLKTTSE